MGETISLDFDRKNGTQNSRRTFQPPCIIYRILHYWWRGTEGGSPGEHRVGGVRETGEKKTRKGGKRDLNEGWNGRENKKGGGLNREVNLPSPYFLSQFLPPPYCFQPISPSSLNVYLTFSPSSLLFPLISPSSQLFWAISPSSLFCSSPLKKESVCYFLLLMIHTKI